MKYKANMPKGEKLTGSTGPLGEVSNGKMRDWKGPKPQNSHNNIHGPMNTPQSHNKPC